jgi:DNA modification methylase
MKLYFHENDIKLIQGDCFDVIDKMIEKNIKIDAIITDPPFLHVKGGMKK